MSPTNRDGARRRVSRAARHETNTQCVMERRRATNFKIGAKIWPFGVNTKNLQKTHSTCAEWAPPPRATAPPPQSADALLSFSRSLSLSKRLGPSALAAGVFENRVFRANRWCHGPSSQAVAPLPMSIQASDWRYWFKDSVVGFSVVGSGRGSSVKGFGFEAFGCSRFRVQGIALGISG